MAKRLYVSEGGSMLNNMTVVALIVTALVTIACATGAPRSEKTVIVTVGSCIFLFNAIIYWLRWKLAKENDNENSHDR